jgi:hypothetical protein
MVHHLIFRLEPKSQTFLLDQRIIAPGGNNPLIIVHLLTGSNQWKACILIYRNRAFLFTEIYTFLFTENLHCYLPFTDGHTLEPQLTQINDMLGRLPETALVDRGYRGRKHILGVNIKIPGSGKGKSPYKKAIERQKFRRRAAIEPIIGHLKYDHRMLRNYLKGVEGDMINTIMAGAAFNMMKKLRKIREAIIFVLNQIFSNWLEKFLILAHY